MIANDPIRITFLPLDHLQIFEENEAFSSPEAARSDTCAERTMVSFGICASNPGLFGEGGGVGA